MGRGFWVFIGSTGGVIGICCGGVVGGFSGSCGGVIGISCERVVGVLATESAGLLGFLAAVVSVARFLVAEVLEVLTEVMALIFCCVLSSTSLGETTKFTCLIN